MKRDTATGTWSIANEESITAIRIGKDGRPEYMFKEGLKPFDDTKYTEEEFEEQLQQVGKILNDPTIKDTKGKLDPTLVPFRALESIVKVREFGNKKYTKDSFYQVPFHQLIDATFRHLLAMYKDENHLAIDNESKLLHIEHALCSLAGAVEILKRST